MTSTNPALISQIQMAFNLLFEEQQLYFSTDIDYSSVSEPASFHPFSIPLQSSQPEMSNLFVPPKTLKKELTSRQKKKQERGAKWKLAKLSGDSFKPEILPNSSNFQVDCVVPVNNSTLSINNSPHLSLSDISVNPTYASVDSFASDSLLSPDTDHIIPASSTSITTIFVSNSFISACTDPEISDTSKPDNYSDADYTPDANFLPDSISDTSDDPTSSSPLAEAYYQNLISHMETRFKLLPESKYKLGPQHLTRSTEVRFPL